MELLFSEELGLVLEVSQVRVDTVRQRYCDAGVECRRIGRTCNFGSEAQVRHSSTRVPSTFQTLWHECFLCLGPSLRGWTGSAERPAAGPQSIMGGHQFPTGAPAGK